MLDVLLLEYDEDIRFRNLSRREAFEDDHSRRVIPSDSIFISILGRTTVSYSNLFILTFLLAGDQRGDDTAVLLNREN